MSGFVICLLGAEGSGNPAGNSSDLWLKCQNSSLNYHPGMKRPLQARIWRFPSRCSWCRWPIPALLISRSCGMATLLRVPVCPCFLPQGSLQSHRKNTQPSSVQLVPSIGEINPPEGKSQKGMRLVDKQSHSFPSEDKVEVPSTTRFRSPVV